MTLGIGSSSLRSRVDRDNRYHRSLRGNQKRASLNDHFQAANREGRNHPRRVFQPVPDGQNTPFPFSLSHFYLFVHRPLARPSADPERAD